MSETARMNRDPYRREEATQLSSSPRGENSLGRQNEKMDFAVQIDMIWLETNHGNAESHQKYYDV